MPNRIAPRFSRALLFALPAALFLFPASVSASCGLQACPRPAFSASVPAWEAGLRTRLVAFDDGGTAGSYVTAAPRLLWRPAAFARALSFGAEVPVTRLQTAGGSRAGLSNPLLTGLYGRRLSAAWSGEMGLQLELPWGDHERGLADDHAMTLPWLGLTRDIHHLWGAPWRVAVLGGYSQALELGGAGKREALPKAAARTAPAARAAHAGEDHEAPAIQVNPHGDRELHWRAGLARLMGSSVVEVFGLGQADLSDGARQYARAGVSWDYALTRAFGLHLTADAPVTVARRAEAEIGVGLKTGW